MSKEEADLAEFENLPEQPEEELVLEGEPTGKSDEKSQTEESTANLFDASRRKKKKKPKRTSKVSFPEASTEAGQEDEGEPAGSQATPNGNASADGEFGYDFLLKRAFDLIGQTKPGATKVPIPPPQAFRIGTSKTLWANFPAIAKALHRNPQHLLNFVIVELGTTANLDGSGRVVIKGRFMPKQLESLVRRYLAEYVVCKTCSSRETTLKKENRLHFLACQSPMCGSVRSVPPLNKGYVHNIKRKKPK